MRSETSERDPAHLPVYPGVLRGGKVELDHPVTWRDGVRVWVQIAEDREGIEQRGHAIIAGFGPAGRWAADVLERFSVPYCIIERNLRTAAAQETLGKRVVLGDASDELTLDVAGVREAGMLVLTIPDEKATIKTIRCARALNEKLVIIARTEYTSTALVARKSGADVVISAEVAVARELHQLLLLALTGNIGAFEPR
jgi:voltage-gated potassium channel Kch